jgi:pimeloyl-ACP methyl ester carboxylesterase
VAVAAADTLFFSPHAQRPTGADVLARGARRVVRTDEGAVVAWSWGHGPNVYLVHGWAGGAGDFAALVPVLTHAGFRAIAFDGPAHGASPGRLSSAPQIGRALAAVVDAYGPAHAVVGHSLGSLATTHALLCGLSAGRAVYLGATAGPRRWARRFARTFGLDARTVHRVRARSEKRLRVSWSELEVARRVTDMDVPLLLVHDREDREVPWSESARLAAAWPGAAFVTTTGLGHRRILKDPSVLARVAAFLREGAPGEEQAAGEDCGHPRPSSWCAACVLEGDLFAPERRRLRAFPA